MIFSLQMNKLQNLLTLAQQTPTDDNLLSQIAFAYLTTPYIKSDELTYFKRAYKVNPSIKNTHNYAFWAYYEYGEYNLAESLFKELINKNPKSFYPYIAYADFLIYFLHFKKHHRIQKDTLHLAIDLLKTAQQKIKNCPITHKNHPYQTLWIDIHLANAYLLCDELKTAKDSYDKILQNLPFCFDEKPKARFDLSEYRYKILFNVFLLLKIQNHTQKMSDEQLLLLQQLKQNEHYDKGDFNFIRRKKGNKLKNYLYHFHRCYLFGCEHCGNLPDDCVIIET